MRIAFVCGFAWAPKGTVRLRAFPIASELVQRGHTVTIFVAPYDHPSDSCKVWWDDGVRILNVEIPKQRVRWLEIGFKLANAVRAFRPDVFHVFKPKGFAGEATEILIATTKLPFFLDCDDWEGWGGWNEAKSYPALMKHFIAWEERRLIRCAHAVSVASQELCSRVASIRESDNSIANVPNCISRRVLEVMNRVRLLDRQELRKEFDLPDCPLILYAGHYESADDALFFTRAGVECPGACLAFAGDGEKLESIRDYLADRPEVQARFFGGMSYLSYLKMVASCDIACFPYPDSPIYRAKCSVRIIEFMAMGKPVVSTNVGQNSAYIEDGVSGLLTAAGDLSGLVRSLQELVRDESLRRQFGVAARQGVLENFIWDGRAAQLCEAMYTGVRFQEPALAMQS